MQSADWMALLPLIILAGSAVLTMTVIAFRRSHLLTAALAIGGLLAALAALVPALRTAPQVTAGLLRMDVAAGFYMALVLAAACVVVLLAYPYLENIRVRREELYVLLLVATTGAAVLVSADHVVTLFLGLELLSVPLYAMIGYLPNRAESMEAGLKYLILAAASAAFLLFGAGLVYAELGVLDFPRLTALALAGSRPASLAVWSGIALMLAGFGFKLAVAPFHLWTPDVYQGAPAPVAAFVATVSKGAMIALLMRLFGTNGMNHAGPIPIAFTAMAIASMIGGNALALLQTNVKRILAYSSIAHLGYILVGFLVGGEIAQLAVAFYVTAYFVTVLGAFGVIAALSDGRGEPEWIDDYRGLFWRRPGVAVVFTLMLLSLTGVPLTGGFFAKYYILAAGASATAWLLSSVLVVTSAAGSYYYLRILVALYSRPDGAESRSLSAVLTRSEAMTLGALSAVLLLLGIFPSLLIWLIPRAG
jgi:NADH-quinone oxidoreductase subunit N